MPFLCPLWSTPPVPLRLFAILAIAFTLTLAVPTLALSQQVTGTEVGEVTASALRIRSGPGTHFPQTGIVRRGDRVRIIDELDGWVHIAKGTVTGWSSDAYVRRLADDVRRGAPLLTEGKVAVVEPGVDGRVFVYDRPSTNGRVVKVLGRTSEVIVMEEGRTWTLVDVPGTGRGHIQSRFLVDY